MARLEIISPSGKVREAPLPESAGLSVGRHASCDIRINAEGVEAVHCRFLPDGDGYRVAAGAESGLQINGSSVAEKRLSEGDTIKVGPAKLRFRADAPADGEESEELALVADSSDALPTWADPQRAKAAEKARGSSGPKSESKNKTASKPKPEKAKPARESQAQEDDGAVSAAAAATIFEEADDDEDDDFDAESEGGDLGALAALAEDETGEEIALSADDEADEDAPVAEAKGEPTDAAPADGPDSGEQPVLLPPGGKFAPLTKLAGPPRRPGEQSIFKSPLVLGLTGAAAALTLAAFTFYFLTAREQADRLYNAADELRSSQKYTAALEAYDQFLLEYPAHPLTGTVRRERGLTNVEQALAARKWAEAVEAIDGFVRENRDLEDFDESHSELTALARRAALGAANEARNGGSRELLATVEDAGKIHRRYADPEAASTGDQTREIAGALKSATAAVVKRETFGEARSKVAAALKKNDFAAAHRAREDLVARYDDLANDRDVLILKGETLSAEADAVVEIPAAEQAPPPSPTPPAVLAPAFASRAATGEPSDGRKAVTRAGPSLFAVNVVTADPIWRAPTGAGAIAPFPAVEAESGATVLICDAIRPALLSVARETGEVNWRSPLPAPATGPPLAGGGQFLIGCEDGSLLAVDPRDGKVTGGLKFPQAVLSPPISADGAAGSANGRLLIPAERNTVYTVAANPPKLLAVSYTGHGAGAVPVPLQPIGDYILMCDNDRADSSLLRALRVDEETGKATEVGRARVNGRIDVPPALRADGLFVSSSPERMTAFAVTDEPGKTVFSRLASAQLPDPKPVPTYLEAGPDGALWAAGTALRKLDLSGDGLRLTPAVLAYGRHVAPPQISGERLFTTRLTPAGTATIFAAAESDDMEGMSRTVLAPAPLAVTRGDRPAILNATGVLTPLGNGFPDADPETGSRTRFLTDGRELPGIDGNGTDPLLARTLPDGGAIAAVGGDDPRAWEIDAEGRAGRPTSLPAAPQLAPLPLGPGLLTPVVGRMEMAVGRTGRSVTAFTQPVSGGDPPAWTAVVKLTDTTAAAFDAGGTIRVIEYRAGSSPSLNEGAAIKPGWFADVPPVAAGEALFVAGSDGKLYRLGISTLSETAAVDLPAAAAFEPAVIGDRVFVALRNGAVAGYAAADLSSPTLTTLPEPAAGPPGPATADGDAAAIVTVAGEAIRFNPTDGAITGQVATGQPLTGPVFVVLGAAVATATDGALVRLDFTDGDGTPAGDDVARGNDSGEVR